MSSCASGRYPKPRLPETISYSSALCSAVPAALQMQSPRDRVGRAFNHYHEGDGIL